MSSRRPKFGEGLVHNFADGKGVLAPLPEAEPGKHVPPERSGRHPSSDDRQRPASTFSTRAQSRLGTCGVQARMPRTEHNDLKTRLEGFELTVQDFLVRLVLAELAQPMSQRQRRRPLHKPAAANTTILQLYLRYDLHKAFKIRAVEYGMTQQDLLLRIVLSWMDHGKVPPALPLPPIPD